MRQIKITLEGDQEMIDAFLEWMSNSGEQEYWNYYEIQGDPLQKVRFDYSTDNEIVGELTEDD